MSGTYESAMRRHEESAQRHEAAAALWETRHEADRAEFERRCAQIEREAAQLDAERAELERLRVNGRAAPDAAVRAEIRRRTGEIERRGARLQADDTALELERVRLWPHHDKREQGWSAPGAEAPRRRAAVASEPEPDPEPGGSEAVDDALDAARCVAGQTRENARHLAAVLSRTANVLERSAALAQANAERLERDGRADAGAKERRAAERGYEAARRARLRAKEWLEFALGRAQ